MLPNNRIPRTTSGVSRPALELKLGPKNGFLTQLFFSAIGLAVPALLGTLCARREQKTSGRVIFLAGDGGLQMTVQVFKRQCILFTYLISNE